MRCSCWSDAQVSITTPPVFQFTPYVPYDSSWRVNQVIPPTNVTLEGCYWGSYDTSGFYECLPLLPLDLLQRPLCRRDAGLPRLPPAAQRARGSQVCATGESPIETATVSTAYEPLPTHPPARSLLMRGRTRKILPVHPSMFPTMCCPRSKPSECARVCGVSLRALDALIPWLLP